MRRHAALLLVSVTGLALASLSCRAPFTSTPTVPVPTPTAVDVTPLPEGELVAGLEAHVVSVYDRVSPSVVNINTERVTYDIFMRPVPQEGTGSGFIYDSEGHVVTNYHVVEDAETISVVLSDGETYDAEVVGVDPSTDLAVLHVDAAGLPAPIPLADSDQLRVGQFVLAIGSPFRQQGSLTVGVISALGRVIESPDGRFIGEAIQTDAAINPGNSGGPLLDLHGRVIGVNSQIISPSQASAGIGFAVSSNTVRRVVPELIARGYYPHPWLGVALWPFDAQGAQFLRENGMEVGVDEGLLVTEIVPGSPADEAGLQGPDRSVRVGRYLIPLGGDIIVAVNGQPTTDMETLTVYLEEETRVGDRLEVTVVREGEEVTLPLVLGERPGR